MKNLAKLIAVAVVSMAPLAFGGVTSYAASTCQIGYTGPGSNNKCVSKTATECEIVNDNNITIDGKNAQDATSGEAYDIDNTTSGTATTGDANNSNSSNYNVTITNGESGKKGCEAHATAPAKTTPTTPATSAKNGNGALKQTVPATTHTKANVLPNTSADQTVTTIAGIMAVLGGGAIIARLASSTVSHIKR